MQTSRSERKIVISARSTPRDLSSIMKLPALNTAREADLSPLKDPHSAASNNIVIQKRRRGGIIDQSPSTIEAIATLSRKISDGLSITTPSSPTKIHSPNDSVSDPKSAAVNRNKSIDRIVKNARKKIKFLSDNNSNRFDSKFKIFQTVNTFIDVKDQLQNINLMNKNEEADEAKVDLHLKNYLSSVGEKEKRRTKTQRSLDPLDSRITSVLQHARGHVLTSRRGSQRSLHNHQELHERIGQADEKLREMTKIALTLTSREI